MGYLSAVLQWIAGKPRKCFHANQIACYIVKRLHELLGDDESGFRNYFGMLETLAENRNLQPNLEEAEKMLTQVDVTKFASYRWGLKAGMAQGMEKGMEQGAMRERLRLAQQLIGLLDEQTIADKTGLSLEEVRQLTLH
jgi:predicted transposase YdaD